MGELLHYVICSPENENNQETKSVDNTGQSAHQMLIMKYEQTEQQYGKTMRMMIRIVNCGGQRQVP